jgi:hypothetical protein
MYLDMLGKATHRDFIVVAELEPVLRPSHQWTVRRAQTHRAILSPTDMVRHFIGADWPGTGAAECGFGPTG